MSFPIEVRILKRVRSALNMDQLNNGSVNRLFNGFQELSLHLIVVGVVQHMVVGSVN